MSRHNNNGSASQATSSSGDQYQVMKKAAGGCTCKKSKCLKLYCQCFASSFLCGPECSCSNCHNTTEFVSERKDAIRVILERNPNAFQTKFQQTVGSDDGVFARNRNSSTTVKEGTTNASVEHKLGCKCRKSSCLKKYCECYSANVKCSSACRCVNCYNVSPPPAGFRRNGVPVVVNSHGLIQESSVVKTVQHKPLVSAPPMIQSYSQSRGGVFNRMVPAAMTMTAPPAESRSDSPTATQKNQIVRKVTNSKEVSTETEEDAAAALMALMGNGRSSRRRSLPATTMLSQLGGDSIGSTSSSNSNETRMVSVSSTSRSMSTASASFDTNSSVSFDHAHDNDSTDGQHSSGYNYASAPPAKRMRRISEELMQQKWPSPPPPPFSNKHESRNDSPDQESIRRGGQAMISLSQFQNRMPFGVTQCDVTRFKPVMARKSLPKGLSYRKICSKCGKTRGEHGELGFGNKCIYQECARCMAGIQCHEKLGVPMGFLCTLTTEQGATPGASKEYDVQLARLAAESITKQSEKQVKGSSSSSDEMERSPSVFEGPSPIINKV